MNEPKPADRGLVVYGQPSPRLDAAALRELLPRLIDAMSDAVVVLDRQGCVVAANRTFERAFGVGGPDVVGRPCPRAGQCRSLSPSPSAEARCIACDIAQHAEPRRALQVVPDAQGALRRWEATLNPVLDDDGTVALVVEVWRDVTDRTQLEAQLAHSERLASLGLLAAGVAHEVNNPLASVLAGVEALKRWLGRTSLPADEARDSAEILDLIETEVQRCQETTDKLLMLGQPYQGQASWVDLNQAARDTLSLLRFAARRQGVHFAEALADDVPAVWVRDSAIRGVFMNLCLNAIQAMAEGGTLTVRTRRAGDAAEFDVADDGPGILEEHLPRIWDPFFTTKPVGQGTGLGLSITRGVVEHYGGSIRVTTSKGQGATFIVSLPVRREEPRSE